MLYNVENYTEQGGEKNDYRGTLEVTEGGKVIRIESTFISAENQHDSIA